MKFKKYLVALTSVALAFSTLTSPALAVVNPGASGSVGYSAYGLQRWAQFDVSQGNTACAKWNVQGTWTVDLLYGGGHNVHDMTLSQTGGNVTGSGGYPAGGPYTYSWNLTGTTSADNVNFTVNYVTGAPGTVMTMTGTIDSLGHMSGNWTDNYGGTRNGTWSTTTGAATQNALCSGTGSFRYADNNGNVYRVNVQYVKVSGNTAYFAGPVTGSVPFAWMSNWLYAKVLDSGAPWGSGDQLWGSFYSMADAKTHFGNLDNPGDGPFPLSVGNLTVHN